MAKLINTTVHRIELIPETRPIAQAPYRAGLKAREIEDVEVQKMLGAGVTEPAQSEGGVAHIIGTQAGRFDAFLCGLSQVKRSDGEGYLPGTKDGLMPGFV